jgi:hypothetical protein
MTAEYRGLKVVELDRKAIVRQYAKKFCKEISKPGVRSISWVIERTNGCNIQSSHRDDSDAAETFAKAAHAMRGF